MTPGRQVAASEYLDCELFITRRDHARLSVADRDFSGRPVLDETLERRLLESDLEPARYGTLLFQALFPDGDDLLTGYRESLAIARHESQRLRLRLHVAAAAPPELHDLHWELLYDRRNEIWLARSQEIAFSRYLGSSFKPGTAVVGRPRLLVVLACPSDLAEYDLADIDCSAVRRALEGALGNLAGQVSYEILEPPATLERIRDRLMTGGFHALHLQAHGQLDPDRAQASLVLEDEYRYAKFIDDEVFAEVLKDLRQLRLVSLIACDGGAPAGLDPFSGLGPALVCRGVPAVVAMRREISLPAATRFAEHLYAELGRSGQVDVAVNEARLRLYLADSESPDSESLEWGTPVLFMHLREGRLWNVEPSDRRLDTGPATLTDLSVRRRLALIAVAAAMLLLLLAALWVSTSRDPLSELTNLTRREPINLALLGFESQGPARPPEWMAIALTELLRFELTDTGRFDEMTQPRLVEQETGLSLSKGTSPSWDLGPEILAQIQEDSEADLVIWGSFITHPEGSSGQSLEMTLSLQGTQTGQSLQSTISGRPQEIPELLSRLTETAIGRGARPVAARLRSWLSGRASRQPQALPPEAERPYSEGLDHLRLLDHSAALKYLEAAEEAAPGSPDIHAALADALRGLGREADAEAAAQDAFNLSRGRSNEERLSFQARLFAIQRRWREAAAISSALWNDATNSLDAGLRLAILQARAGWGDEALATFESLRPLVAADDPGFHLLEAEIGRGASRYGRQKEAAQRAATYAEQQDAPFVLARALHLQGTALQHLGELKAAKLALKSAQETYRELGHVQGQTLAHLETGNVFWTQQDLAGAKDHWEEAGSLVDTIGNLRLEAKVLMNKGLVAQEQGNVEAAVDLFRDSLAMSRAAGDRASQTFTMIAIADHLEKQGRLAEAEALYTTALELEDQLGRRRFEDYLLRMRGTLSRKQGKLPEAHRFLERALRKFEQSEDHRGRALATFELAAVLHAQGKLERAKDLYAELLRFFREVEADVEYARVCTSMGNVLQAEADFDGARRNYIEALDVQNRSPGRDEAARTLTSLARLLIAEGRLDEAVATAREAAADFGRTKSALEQAQARGVLALALLARGQVRRARQEIDAARELLSDVESPFYRLPVELAAARIRVAEGEADEARDDLEAVLAAAIEGGFVGRELETQLHLGRLDLDHGSAAAGRARLRGVEATATRAGFGGIARRALELRAGEP